MVFKFKVYAPALITNQVFDVNQGGCVQYPDVASFSDCE